MSEVNVLVQTGYGLNCDIETAHAFALAGASPTRIHINSLVDGSVRLESYQILVFGGGFSWGDDHGAGVIHAVRFKTHIGGAASGIYRQGKTGHWHLQWISDPGESGPAARHRRGLPPAFRGAHLQRLRQFQGPVGFASSGPRVPLRVYKGNGRTRAPVRHGEGKFYAEPAVISQLEENHQVVLRYCLPDGSPADGRFPHNPNGSLHDIAGICDQTGRVFGLMPHPEAYHHVTNHPDWTRIREVNRRKGITEAPGVTPGIRILENAVNFIRSR